MDSLGNNQTQAAIFYMIPMLQNFLNDRMIEAGNRGCLRMGEVTQRKEECGYKWAERWTSFW